MTYDPNQDNRQNPRTLSGGTMLLVIAGMMIVAGLIVSTWSGWRNDPATAIVEKNSTTTGQTTK
jgi:hypothetical protein